LRQTGKMEKSLPVVLYDEKFWKDTIRFENFVKAGLISAQDLSLFGFASTPENTWAELLRRGLFVPKD
jgi:predicted Rossmann-fold nucleotide-binding protein